MVSGSFWGMVNAFQPYRAVYAVEVLCSMLVKEVLKVASSAASMSFLRLASVSRRLVSASNVRSLILSMCPVCSDSWARFLAGVFIVPGRASMVWILLLRLAKPDMLVSGAGLVIGGAVSGAKTSIG